MTTHNEWLCSCHCTARRIYIFSQKCPLTSKDALSNPLVVWEGDKPLPQIHPFCLTLTLTLRRSSTLNLRLHYCVYVWRTEGSVMELTPRGRYGCEFLMTSVFLASAYQGGWPALPHRSIFPKSLCNGLPWVEISEERSEMSVCSMAEISQCKNCRHVVYRFILFPVKSVIFVAFTRKLGRISQTHEVTLGKIRWGTVLR